MKLLKLLTVTIFFISIDNDASSLTKNRYVVSDFIEQFVKKQAERCASEKMKVTINDEAELYGGIRFNPGIFEYLSGKSSNTITISPEYAKRLDKAALICPESCDHAQLVLAQSSMDFRRIIGVKNNYLSNELSKFFCCTVLTVAIMGFSHYLIDAYVVDNNHKKSSHVGAISLLPGAALGYVINTVLTIPLHQKYQYARAEDFALNHTDDPALISKMVSYHKQKHESDIKFIQDCFDKRSRRYGSKELFSTKKCSITREQIEKKWVFFELFFYKEKPSHYSMYEKYKRKSESLSEAIPSMQ